MSARPTTNGSPVVITSGLRLQSMTDLRFSLMSDLRRADTSGQAEKRDTSSSTNLRQLAVAV